MDPLTIIVQTALFAVAVYCVAQILKTKPRHRALGTMYTRRAVSADKNQSVIDAASILVWGSTSSETWEKNCKQSLQASLIRRGR